MGKIATTYDEFYLIAPLCHLLGNYFIVSDVELPSLKLISAFPMQTIYSFLAVIFILTCSSTRLVSCQNIPLFQTLNTINLCKAASYYSSYFVFQTGLHLLISVD